VNHLPLNSSSLPVETGSESSLPRAITFGSYCTIMRRLRSADAERLIEFFQSHTEDTVRSRYGYLLAEMSPTRAAELAGIDQSKDAALGVFEMEGLRPRLIAIGRYCLSPETASAEVAFVVHEGFRNLGIATCLLEALARIAQSHGLCLLTAQVQEDNGPMLAVFRKAGAGFAVIPGTGAEQARIAVTADLLERLHACHLKHSVEAPVCSLPPIPRWEI
jgi:GNAT superfamily N-acetyltransferase